MDDVTALACALELVHEREDEIILSLFPWEGHPNPARTNLFIPLV